MYACRNQIIIFSKNHIFSLLLSSIYFENLIWVLFMYSMPFGLDKSVFTLILRTKLSKELFGRDFNAQILLKIQISPRFCPGSIFSLSISKWNFQWLLTKKMKRKFMYINICTHRYTSKRAKIVNETTFRWENRIARRWIF